MQDVAANDDESLLAYLANRDVTCPLCDYNLRNLTSPRCPECGRDLKLSVGLTEPYLRAWITTCCVAAANAGLGLFLLLMTLRFGFPGRGDGTVLQIVFFCYFVSPIFSAAIIARRRSMLKWGRPAQFMMAGITIVLSILMAILLIYFIK